MDPVRHIIRQKVFYLAIALVFVVQYILLIASTPLYELDTNSYVQGMFSWSIYHNPFGNLFFGALTKIWPDLWFVISMQILLYACCVSFFLFSLKIRSLGLFMLALLLAAIEPVTTFYNFSLISDSSFTSFVLLFSGLLILYLEKPSWQGALLFGAAVGLAFLARLSANIFLPLFGLILLVPATSWRNKVRDLLLGILPFAASYFFVLIGQSLINEGGLYTVKGRVLWDFVSSQYDPDEIDAPQFEAYVNPYIFPNGQLEPLREKRRELAYLGYKDCQAAREAAGEPVGKAILQCDSLWGAAAQQISAKHFWQAERQFVQDNFADIHGRNYLEYRFTPGLHYYHPEAENQYIDSVMKAVYGFSLAKSHENIPKIWTSTDFLNVYVPILYWILFATALLGGILWLKDRSRWRILIPALVIAIPFLFHLVYISYRLRFIAPYLVLGIGLIVFLVDFRFRDFRR